MGRRQGCLVMHSFILSRRCCEGGNRTEKGLQILADGGGVGGVCEGCERFTLEKKENTGVSDENQNTPQPWWQRCLDPVHGFCALPGRKHLHQNEVGSVQSVF